QVPPFWFNGRRSTARRSVGDASAACAQPGAIATSMAVAKANAAMVTGAMARGETLNFMPLTPRLRRRAALERIHDVRLTLRLQPCQAEATIRRPSLSMRNIQRRRRRPARIHAARE